MSCHVSGLHKCCEKTLGSAGGWAMGAEACLPHFFFLSSPVSAALSRLFRNFLCLQVSFSRFPFLSNILHFCPFSLPLWIFYPALMFHLNFVFFSSFHALCALRSCCVVLLRGLVLVFLLSFSFPLPSKWCPPAFPATCLSVPAHLECVATFPEFGRVSVWPVTLWSAAHQQLPLERASV